MKNPWSKTAWIILALGVFFRMHHYWGNRCLWHDEAVLVLNVLSHSYSGLIKQPLMDFPPTPQIAPLGFLLPEKAIGQLTGSSEKSFRLLPLLASLAGLFLFFPLARRLLPEKEACLALGFIAISRMPVYYSAEVKPYVLDVLISILLYLAAQRILSRKDRTSTFFLLAAGVLAVWFSFPAAFILCAIGLGLAFEALRSRDRKGLFLAVGLSSAWLTSFATALVVTFPHDPISYRNLQNIWAFAFSPSLSEPLRLLKWALNAFFHFFENPMGFQWTAGLAAFLCLLGAFQLWKRNRVWLIMLTLPLGLALAAAVFRLYPFEARLLLFLVPGFFLVVVHGLQALWPEPGGNASCASRKFLGIIMIQKDEQPPGSLEKETLRRDTRLAAGIMAGLLLFQPALNALANTFRKAPYERQNMRDALSYIERHSQPGDKLFLQKFNRKSFLYYQEHYDLPDFQVFLGLGRRGEWNIHYEDIRSLPQAPRLWFILHHVPGEEGSGFSTEDFILILLDKRGRCLDRMRTEGISVFLYNITNDLPESPDLSADALKLPDCRGEAWGSYLENRRVPYKRPGPLECGIMMPLLKRRHVAALLNRNAYYHRSRVARRAMRS